MAPGSTLGTVVHGTVRRNWRPAELADQSLISPGLLGLRRVYLDHQTVCTTGPTRHRPERRLVTRERGRGMSRESGLQVCTAASTAACYCIIQAIENSRCHVHPVWSSKCETLMTEMEFCNCSCWFVRILNSDVAGIMVCGLIMR